MRACATLLALVVCVSSATGDERQDQAARAAFAIGKTAYENGDYQLAYDKFQESFELSHEPALLYNIASALQGLKRPHDAAETLRNYLTLKPDDPDRQKIEERIATLEVEQKMIDADRQRAEAEARAEAERKAAAAKAEAERKAAEEPARHPALTPPPPPSQTVVLVPTGPSAAEREAERKRKRRDLIIGLSVGGAVLVAGAITLGVLLGQGPPPYTTTSLGPHPGTL